MYTYQFCYDENVEAMGRFSFVQQVKMKHENYSQNGNMIINITFQNVM